MTAPFPIQTRDEFNPDALIHAMVAIRSESREEAALAAWLVEQMRALDYDEAFVDESGNAVGVRAGEAAVGAQQDVVLLGHMDTVPGEIPVRVDDDGVLHGRGAVDAKGPLATFIAAAALATPPPGVRWIVIGAVEEEIASSKGARFVRDRYAPAACVIGEPSGWEGVVLGYKGRMLARYRATAPGGHSAGPLGGVAEAATAWWERVRAHCAAYNESNEKLFDQILPALLDINTASDGLYDVASATVSLRLPPACDLGALEQAVTDAAGKTGEVTCEGRELAYQSSRTTPLARAFVRAIAAQDGRARFKVKTGTADMNVVGPAWDCSIVAYGPGDSTLDHTPEERLDLAEYRRAIDVLRGVLESLEL